jgi:hypothetical protein
MQLVKLTGTNFVRDIDSMAIFPTDAAAKNDYIAKTKAAMLQKSEINNLKSEIDDIKTDVSEIKNLLQKLIGKE